MQVYPATAIALRSDSYVTIASRGSPASLERWTATTLPLLRRCMTARWESPTNADSLYVAPFFALYPAKKNGFLAEPSTVRGLITALLNFEYTKIEGKKALPSGNLPYFFVFENRGYLSLPSKKIFFNMVENRPYFFATVYAYGVELFYIQRRVSAQWYQI